MYPEAPQIMSWVKRELSNMRIWNDDDNFSLFRHRDWRDNRDHEGWVALILRISGEDEKDKWMYGMRFTHDGVLLKFELFDFRKFSEHMSPEGLDNAFRGFKNAVDKHVMHEDWYLKHIW